MKVADHQLDEIFEMINSSADVEVSLRQTCKTNPIVKFYVHLACDDRWIDFDLQDLNYKFSEFHRSLCGAYLISKSTMNIITEIIFNSKIPKKTKYFQTKNLMELLSISEAKVFEAILKKNLPTMYPHITHEMMVNIE
ncbi:hypothetical protein GW931_04150 [archaeon]|nr:hypothetical protein [archaeon]